MMPGGAVLWLDGLFYVCLHAEFIGDDRLFFIAHPAQSQADAHTIKFTRAETPWDRDVSMFDAAGIMFADLVPAIECPEVDANDVRAVLAGFRAPLEDPQNATTWAEFVARERPRRRRRKPSERAL